MSGYFVTGTDTDAGKTLVTAALLARAGGAGLRTLALKPVAAGAERTAEGLRNSDALILQGAANQPCTYDDINPFCLAPAIAPHIAAREAGVILDAITVAARCRPMLGRAADLLLVEGAGGWRVPLNDRESFADLARVLGFPVILVVGMKLGCINHALLTADAIRADGLEVAGWVANRVAPTMSRYRENRDTLAQRLGAPLLGEVPFIAGGDYRQAAQWLVLPDSG
ncbi:MAG: dethiobiotin synthase [Porticoccaceae bacterium]